MTNRENASDRRRRSHSTPLPSNHSSSTSSIEYCCCCLFIILIIFAILTIASVLVVVLVLHPKKPEFDLQQVGVENLYLSPTEAISADQTAPATYLSMNIALLFTAVNPNKVGIKYAPVEFHVMHKGLPLAVATVPGFEQPAHSTRTVETRVSVSWFNVLQADAAEIVRDASVNDRMELQVTGDVGAKVLILGLRSPRVQVSLFCTIVISPKKQSVTSKQCVVDGLNV